MAMYKRVHSAHEQVIYNPNRPSDAVPFVIARDHRRRVTRVDDRAGGLHSAARLSAVFRVRGVRRRRVPRHARARLERRPRAAPRCCWPRSLWRSRSGCRWRSPRSVPTATWSGTAGTAACSTSGTTRTSSCRRIRPWRHTHTDETRMMPSRNWRTPYLPSAQLFFRLVVGLHDSSRVMKLALIVCDLLTIVVVWRWLATTGRREWLALAYAWNPLVVLEIAHSGHIDALGMTVDCRVGLLAVAAAHGTGVDRVRAGGHDQAAADRALAALLETRARPRRGGRSRGVRAAVSAVCRRQTRSRSARCPTCSRTSGSTVRCSG